MRFPFLLAFLFTTAVAQDTGALSGRVLDVADGVGLPGANVVLEGTTFGAATDLDGNYRITGIPAGTYTVVARFVGYTESEEEVRVRAGEISDQDFELDDGPWMDDCCMIICYYRPMIVNDIYSPRVIVANDVADSDPCGCPGDGTIDLRSLPIGR